MTGFGVLLAEGCGWRWRGRGGSSRGWTPARALAGFVLWAEVDRRCLACPDRRLRGLRSIRPLFIVSLRSRLGQVKPLWTLPRSGDWPRCAVVASGTGRTEEKRWWAAC
jgi:hypothetical protein